VHNFYFDFSEKAVHFKYFILLQIRKLKLTLLQYFKLYLILLNVNFNLLSLATLFSFIYSIKVLMIKSNKKKEIKSKIDKIFAKESAFLLTKSC